MALTLGFSLAVMCCGLAVLRGFGLAKGALAFGMAPSAGLGVAAIVSTWIGLLRLPPPFGGLVFVVLTGTGLALAIRDWRALGAAAGALWREHQVASSALVLAVVVPVIGMGVGFAGVQAPLSPHDGAFHVETSDAFRVGTAGASWYPPGLAALFGAVLQLVPFVDSAAGAFDLGLGLSLLAPLAVFGLGLAVLRNLFAASAAALLSGLTYLFPYYPQVWGGWPQLMGLLLVIGVWSLAVLYVEHPSVKTGVLVGIVVGAVIVVHGIEVYTAAILLLLLTLARWRCLAWGRLAVHVPLAVGVALVCAAPYLPSLVHWAGGGGAFEVGLQEGAAMAAGAKSTTAGELLGVFTLDALGIDLPVRLVLLALGVLWVFRRRTGGLFLAAACVFVGLACLSSFLSGVDAVRVVNAATYPWSLPFRHMTVAAIPLALVAGAGCHWVAFSFWPPLLARLRGAALRRRVDRVGRLLVVSWLVLTTWALTIFLSVPAGVLSSFTQDDGAAMAWLRGHASPGDVVVNDGYADAGIWAPYKAGLPTLVTRSGTYSAEEEARRYSVLTNVGALETVAEAACAENVRYVYYGAKTSDWDKRRFPPLATLEASPALEEDFRQGGAVVFAVRLNCAT